MRDRLPNELQQKPGPEPRRECPWGNGSTAPLVATHDRSKHRTPASEQFLTPSGNWSSFPPHRHDGRFGTTYHEESYYYRLTPGDGFAIQRLYTRDTDLDVSIAAADGDLVLVHEGYHTVATAPGTNAYYLNFLAGDTKPVVQLNDPAYAWVADDWTGRPIAIPVEPTA